MPAAPGSTRRSTSTPTAPARSSAAASLTTSRPSTPSWSRSSSRPGCRPSASRITTEELVLTVANIATVRRVLTGCIGVAAALLLVAGMPAVQAAAPAVFTVAPTGTGKSCSPAAPCSFATAQQQVRAAAPTMKSDLVVQLTGGTYRLAAPLSFGPADSGQHGHRVISRAAGGAHPVLDGGRAVSGWRMADPAKGIWAAPVPAGLQTRQFFVNGQRVPRTSGKPTVTMVQTSDGYLDPSGTLAGWRNPSDIEFVFNMA